MELKSGNLDTALDLGKQMQKDHPELSMGYEIEALVYFRQGKQKAGVEALEKAHRIKPSAALVDNLARKYQESGRFEEARKIIEDWLEEHPDDLGIRILYATLLQTQGKYDEAQKVYEKAIEQAPDQPVILNNLAWLYDRKGDARAAAIAKRAYELAPTRPEIEDTYGWILAKNGKYEQGLRILQDALTKLPGNPEISYHVIYALNKLGRKKEANRIAAQLMRKYPESPFTAKARELVK